MRRKPLVWKLFPFCFAIILVSASILSLIIQPADAVSSRTATIVYRLLTTILAIVALAALMSLLTALKLAKPLAQLRNTVAAFANGDFRSRAPATDIAELADLTNSLNRMAVKIEEQLRDMARQSAQQAAILASMREGVLAVADDDRILILNQAAANLLNVSLEGALGRPLQEAVRNPALNRFIEQIRRGQQPAEEDRVFRAQRDRLVQMSAAELRDPEGKHLGVLIVLSDITQSAKLDQMRRDFVANVSHELKTPITAIKGYVETILESKNLDPNKAREFLETTARQADRLNTIIDDLLKLAEIEQKAESAQIEIEIAPIRPVLEMAAANCRAIASDRKITTEVNCPDEILAPINPPLLERAVTNLIDNAVKYSPEGSHVRVVGELINGEVAIRVIDNGPGIAPEHIPRLFERFYRVDTARSRKLGGTGLGLAIVKHIAQAHGGRVDVQSVLGEGSTFTIYLPTKPA